MDRRLDTREDGKRYQGYPAEGQNVWWVLWTGFCEGDWNMAVDEWLMATAADRPPTLRLYGWHRPTVSLGRNERWRGAVRLAELHRLGVRLVRRPTGGRAVLHHRELTYSVTGVPDRDAALCGRLEETLARIATALSAGLRQLGVEAAIVERRTPQGRRKGPCFESATRYELRARGAKVVGSAQYRTATAFLQHGSIPAYPTLSDLHRIAGVEPRVSEKSDKPAPWRNLAADETGRAIVRGFRESFAARVEQRGQGDLDLDAVRHLASRRYAHAAWTFRR
jgi:lipoate-protein ligase A